MSVKTSLGICLMEDRDALLYDLLSMGRSPKIAGERDLPLDELDVDEVVVLGTVAEGCSGALWWNAPKSSSEVLTFPKALSTIHIICMINIRISAAMDENIISECHT